MVSKFFPTQRLLDPTMELEAGGLRAGVCAMGPLEEDGKTIVSMEVWIFQESGAMCSGRLDEPISEGNWMIVTGLAEGSAPFDESSGAKAMAIAVVRDGSGGIAVDQWDEDVRVDRRHLREGLDASPSAPVEGVRERANA